MKEQKEEMIFSGRINRNIVIKLEIGVKEIFIRNIS